MRRGRALDHARRRAARSRAHRVPLARSAGARGARRAISRKSPRAGAKRAPSADARGRRGTRAHGLYLSLRRWATQPSARAARTPAPKTAAGDGARCPARGIQRARSPRSAPTAWRHCGPGRSARRASRAPEYSYTVRGREVRGDNYSESLSHNPIPKLARAAARRAGAKSLRFLQNENLPGAYPYTGGVYPVPARGRRSDAHVRGRGRARNAPIAASITSRAATRPRACPPPSTPPRCTAKTRTCGRTSSAAPATPACRSPRSTT